MKKEILVGIHQAIHRKVDPELQVFRKILEHNNISYIDLDSSDLNFWEKLKDVSHFIYKWSHYHSDSQKATALIPVIQYQKKIKCFPNWETSWHYDDKVKQAYLMKENGFPICDSYVFYYKDKALEWAKNVKLPVVFKLKGGSGSANVQLIHTREKVISLIKKMFGRGINQDSISFFFRIKTFNYNPKKIFRHYAIKIRNRLFGRDVHHFWQIHKNYVLFQKYMTGNTYDTRVQVTGKRAFAFIRYNRKNDFRASGSNNWSLDHSKIDMRFVKMALEISRKLGFQSMAYDFIYDENRNPAIVEISYCYGDYPEFSTGFWDENLVWHKGQYVPQYLELIDLLEKEDLVQPPGISAGSSYKDVKTN